MNPTSSQLGLAMAITAIAAAGAPDLPTSKASPIDYIGLCGEMKIAEFVIPFDNPCTKAEDFIVSGAEAANRGWQYYKTFRGFAEAENVEVHIIMNDSYPPRYHPDSELMILKWDWSPFSEAAVSP
jgi:hypothetical protein